MTTRVAFVIAMLLGACTPPTDERATLDGSVAHPRCESCHVSDFERVEDPPHASELPSTCFVCHTQEAWSPAQLQHDFYPLTGAHLDARCFSCHRIGSDDNEPRFEGTDRRCVHCHRDDFERSEFPGHRQFGVECGDCHATAAWAPSLHGSPDAWVAIPDAGTPDWVDEISHPSRFGGTGLGGGGEPPLPPPHDAGTDAGHRRRPPRHPPPSTTTEETPPDVHTRPSMRGR